MHSAADKPVALAWLEYLKGKDQLSLNDYQGALISAEKAIAINPNSGWAWRLKSDAERQLGNYEAGKISAENANKIAWSWCIKSDQQFYLGDYHGALASAKKAIEIDEHSAWGWRLKSDAQQNLGDYEGALVSIKKAIEIEPDSERAWKLKDELQQYLSVYQAARESTESDKWLSTLFLFLCQKSGIFCETEQKIFQNSYTKLFTILGSKSNGDKIIPQKHVESPIGKNIEDTRDDSFYTEEEGKAELVVTVESTRNKSLSP